MRVSHLFRSIFCRQNLPLSGINITLLSRNAATASTIEISEAPAVKSASHKAAISKVMRAYLQRSVEHEKFINAKVTEYEIGKRHLANMMGENPESFTQEDIDNALAYLMPSGLYEPKARPFMKHPMEIFAKRKAAEFDQSGRPFHTLFYTGRPAYYSLLQEISIKAQQMDDLLVKIKGRLPEETVYYDGSKWLSKEEMENIILEVVPDDLFNHFICSMERLMSHKLGVREKDFILKFRKEKEVKTMKENIPPLMYTEGGIPYMTATGDRRMAKAQVKVLGQGSGQVGVNEEDILYFDSTQDREQIMFPLQLTGLLRAVDVEATVEGGGKSGQAGAMRYAISLALRSFVPEVMVEKMRIAGLLTKDARKKERKKPGQRRARAKFTWKKR